MLNIECHYSLDLPFSTRYFLKSPPYPYDNQYDRVPASTTPISRGYIQKPVRWSNPVRQFWFDDVYAMVLEAMHIKLLLKDTPRLCLRLLEELHEKVVVVDIVRLYIMIRK